MITYKDKFRNFFSEQWLFSLDAEDMDMNTMSKNICVEAVRSELGGRLLYLLIKQIYYFRAKKGSFNKCVAANELSTWGKQFLRQCDLSKADVNKAVKELLAVGILEIDGFRLRFNPKVAFLLISGQ